MPKPDRLPLRLAEAALAGSDGPARAVSVLLMAAFEILTAERDMWLAADTLVVTAERMRARLPKRTVQ